MFKKLLISLAFDLLNSQLVSKIGFLPLREWLSKRVKDAEQIANLLADGNPNNNQQLQQFWEENKARLADDSIEAAIRIVEERVKDGDAKDTILRILRALDPDGNLPSA